MKKYLTIGLTLFSFGAFAQTQKSTVYVKGDVTTRTQSEINAQADSDYKINTQTKNTAMSYFTAGNYEDAIYYAKRIGTSANDGDYLYTQKTQILCLSYAHLGDKKNCKKMFKKVQKKSRPSEVKFVIEELQKLGLVE